MDRDSFLEHKGVQVTLSGRGWFQFELEDMRYEVPSFQEATEKIDQVRARKRTAVRVPCWLVIGEPGGGAGDGEAQEGEYCGIHAGWKTHAYRRKDDSSRRPANNWSGGEVVFPTRKAAEEYVRTLVEIDRLTEWSGSLGFRMTRGVPDDYEKRCELEQTVVDYLEGRKPRPDAE